MRLVRLEDKEVTMLKQIMDIPEHSDKCFDVKLYDIKTDKLVGNCKGRFKNGIQLFDLEMKTIFKKYDTTNNTITTFKSDDFTDLFKARFRVKSYKNNIKEVVVPCLKISSNLSFSLDRYVIDINPVDAQMLYTIDGEIFSVINDEWY